MSTITYSKTEKVRIRLEEEEIIDAIKAYLANRLTVPGNADIEFDAGGDIFRGVDITWEEGPETIVEELP